LIVMIEFTVRVDLSVDIYELLSITFELYTKFFADILYGVIDESMLFANMFDVIGGVKLGQYPGESEYDTAELLMGV